MAARDNMNEFFLDTMWNCFLMQPRGSMGHLCLPKKIKVNTAVLITLMDRIHALSINDRPGSISIDCLDGFQFENVEDPAPEVVYLAEVIKPCKQTLRHFDVCVDNICVATIECLSCALGYSTQALENLVSLRLGFEATEEANLVDLFTSSKCKIKLFEINVNETNVDMIRQVFQSYGGLQTFTGYFGFENDVFNEQIGRMFESIGLSPSRLTHLNMDSPDCNLSDSNFLAAGTMIQSQDRLQVFGLSHFKLCTGNPAPFFQAIGEHPALQEIIFKCCLFSNENLASFLWTIKHNSTISKLNLLHSKGFDLSGRWVQILPSLKHLRSLGGIECFEDPKWKSVLLPVLHKNTSLIELDYTPHRFSRICEREVVSFDPDTDKILFRNKYLGYLSHFDEPEKPPLSVWPILLEQMASRKVDGSAMYAFLRKTAAEIPESKLLQENRSLVKENKELKMQLLKRVEES